MKLNKELLKQFYFATTIGKANSLLAELIKADPANEEEYRQTLVDAKKEWDALPSAVRIERYEVPAEKWVENLIRRTPDANGNVREDYVYNERSEPSVADIAGAIQFGNLIDRPKLAVNELKQKYNFPVNSPDSIEFINNLSEEDKSIYNSAKDLIRTIENGYEEKVAQTRGIDRTKSPLAYNYAKLNDYFSFDLALLVNNNPKLDQNKKGLLEKVLNSSDLSVDLFEKSLSSYLKNGKIDEAMLLKELEKNFIGTLTKKEFDSIQLELRKTITTSMETVYSDLEKKKNFYSNESAFSEYRGVLNSFAKEDKVLATKLKALDEAKGLYDIRKSLPEPKNDISLLNYSNFDSTIQKMIGLDDEQLESFKSIYRNYTKKLAEGVGFNFAKALEKLEPKLEAGPLVKSEEFFKEIQKLWKDGSGGLEAKLKLRQGILMSHSDKQVEELVTRYEERFEYNDKMKNILEKFPNIQISSSGREIIGKDGKKLDFDEKIEIMQEINDKLKDSMSEWEWNQFKYNPEFVQLNLVNNFKEVNPNGLSSGFSRWTEYDGIRIDLSTYYRKFIDKDGKEQIIDLETDTRLDDLQKPMVMFG